MTGTGWEVGHRDGQVVLIVSVADDDTGGISAAGLTMSPDEGKQLVNSLGEVILCVSRTGVMT